MMKNCTRVREVFLCSVLSCSKLEPCVDQRHNDTDHFAESVDVVIFKTSHAIGGVMSHTYD